MSALYFVLKDGHLIGQAADSAQAARLAGWKSAELVRRTIDGTRRLVWVEL